MIIGIGSDIVENKRIEAICAKFGEKFYKRLFSANELYKDFSPQQVAARFAAKEAVVKALGTGFTKGIALADVQIIACDMGKPIVKLANKAEEVANELGVTNIHLSFSHEKEYSIAFVVLSSM